MFKNLLILALATLSFGTFANSGKGIIGHFEAFSVEPGDNQTDGYIYLTNVAAEPITVTITVYDRNGNIIREQDNNASAGIIKVDDASNYSDGVTYTAKFNIGVNSTSRFWLDANYGSWYRGYAVVEWEKSTASNLVLQNALIANAMIYRSFERNVGYYIIPVNNGAPF